MRRVCDMLGTNDESTLPALWSGRESGLRGRAHTGSPAGRQPSGPDVLMCEREKWPVFCDFSEKEHRGAAKYTSCVRKGAFSSSLDTRRYLAGGDGEGACSGVLDAAACQHDRPTLSMRCEPMSWAMMQCVAALQHESLASRLRR